MVCAEASLQAPGARFHPDLKARPEGGILSAMPIVLPFRAVRPAGASDPSARLSPPYDVIAPDERVRLAKDPHNAVHLELPESHRLIELDVPPALEGLTVAEAAPRARFGISVLAVNRMGRDGVERRFAPGAADRFEHGDVLVVLGTEEAIARLQDARVAPVTAG